MNRRWLAAALAVAIAAIPAAVPAVSPVPRLINYQGLLVDQNTGQPLQGAHDLTFRIYDGDLMDSTVLWEETHAGVSVTDGLFNVILGATVLLTDALFGDAERWLGTSVSLDEEISPRMRLTAVPWALRAAVADSLAGGGSGSADADWIVSGNNMYAGVPGNIGIGNSNPYYKLDVLGGSFAVRRGTDPDQFLYQSCGSYANYLTSHLREANKKPFYIQNLHDDGGSGAGEAWMRFSVGSTSAPAHALYIRENGNVGVGTFDALQKLDVGGTARVQGFQMPTGASAGYVLTSDAAGTGTWQVPGASGADGDWVIAGSNLYLAVAGNVGVGTASPNCKLDAVSGSLRAELCDTDSDLGVTNYAGVRGSYGSMALGYLGHRFYSPMGESYHGVYAEASGASNCYGVTGYNTDSGNFGRLGSPAVGASGQHIATFNSGELGTAYAGVNGVNRVNGDGDNPGVYGKNEPTNNYGYLGGDLLGGYIRHGSTANNVQLGAGSFALRAQAFAGDAALFYGSVKVIGARLTVEEIEITGGADLSEKFEIRNPHGPREPEPGMLVCIDPQCPGQLVVSARAYDRTVAGVISGAGGIAPGMLMGQAGSRANGASPVALSGRVYCCADARGGAIEPGDLLTTSDTPGHAMRAADSARSHGAVIGKAMTALAEGRGLVLVLVNLQ